MTTASLELCKELFELSGWNDVQLGKYAFNGDLWHSKDWLGKGDVPAYDLGYMLRKLPKGLSLYLGAKYYNFQLGGSTGSPSVWDIVKQGDFRADTPEDAACKLAIELFKQRVLTR